MSSTEQTRPPITVSEQAETNFVNTTYFTETGYWKIPKSDIGPGSITYLIIPSPILAFLVAQAAGLLSWRSGDVNRLYNWLFLVGQRRELFSSQNQN